MKASRISFFFIFLCASVFYACIRQKPVLTETTAPLHFNELRTVEQLLETDPAKALENVEILVEEAQESQFSTLDSVELQLRIVQAQYKNRCLTELSPDLTPVLAFYDSISALFPADVDLQFLLANAFYYKGVQLVFANEDVLAFTQYLKAMDVMRRHVDWSETPTARRFIALTYTRQSEILYRYGLPDAAMETCRMADDYYDSESDHAAMLRFEAAIHQSKKEYDKALALFHEAEDLVATGTGFSRSPT